jgi:hypothetical protein
MTDDWLTHSQKGEMNAPLWSQECSVSNCARSAIIICQEDRTMGAETDWQETMHIVEW